MNTAIKSRPLKNQFAFEETREALIKILTLRPLLSRKDEEALSILVDKKLMKQLQKSLGEIKEKKLEPLKNILK